MNTGKKPLLIGLRAAKANFLPGLALQGLMVALVVGYYWVPATQPWFAVLADAKARGGFIFSILASAVAGGVLPELFVIFFLQKGKATPANLHNILFSACLWGFEGFTVDLFYRGQALWFGTEASFGTVVKKVLVDQFIYTPFYATPFSVIFYKWKNHGYAVSTFHNLLRPEFYTRQCFPALIANWGVWIPLVAVIYSLPLLLQVPLFLLALTFWVMILSYITSNSDPASSPSTT